MFTVTIPVTAVAVDGHTCYRVGDEHGILARRDWKARAWVAVEALERSLDDDELCRSYGLWTDREVTAGLLWWKKVVRPRDGVIQEDEILTFVDYKHQKSGAVCVTNLHHPTVQHLVKVGIEVGASGAVLEEHWEAL